MIGAELSPFRERVRLNVPQGSTALENASTHFSLDHRSDNEAIALHTSASPRQGSPEQSSLPDYESDDEPPTIPHVQQLQQENMKLSKKLADTQSDLRGLREELALTNSILNRAEAAEIAALTENDWFRAQLRAVMRDLEHATRYPVQSHSLGSPRGLPVSSDLYTTPPNRRRHEFLPIPPRWVLERRRVSNPDHQPIREAPQRRRAISSERGTPIEDPRAAETWVAEEEPDSLPHHQFQTGSQDPFEEESPTPSNGRKRKSSSVMSSEAKRRRNPKALPAGLNARDIARVRRHDPPHRRRPNAAELNQEFASPTSKSVSSVASSPLFRQQTSPRSRRGSDASPRQHSIRRPARRRPVGLGISGLSPPARTTRVYSPRLTRSRAVKENITLPGLFNRDS